jgi:hypothetical protein
MGLLQESQIKKANKFSKEWLKNHIFNYSYDKEKIKSICKKLYEINGLECPTIYFTSDPYEALLKARSLMEGEETLNEESFSFCWGDSAGFALIEFIIQEFSIQNEKVKELSCCLDCAKEMGFTLFFDKAIITSPKPDISFSIPVEDLTLERPGVLHSHEKAAIGYGKDSEINRYFSNGVFLPRYVIENPEKITVDDIENERNVEIRRVKINRYGQERYLLDSDARIVAEDDFGILYRKTFFDDEPLMMVKVVNSTPEPDGTFKDYFLRVDPNAYGGLKTARAAVASTWRHKDGSLVFENPEDYCDNLIKES